MITLLLLALILLSACTAENNIIIPQLSVTLTDGGNLDGHAINIAEDGGELIVNVVSNSSWIAKSNADWLTLSKQNGEGNGSISITASAAEQSRSAAVEVYLSYYNQIRSSFDIIQHVTPKEEQPEDNEGEEDEENPEDNTGNGENEDTPEDKSEEDNNDNEEGNDDENQENPEDSNGDEEQNPEDEENKEDAPAEEDKENTDDTDNKEDNKDENTEENPDDNKDNEGNGDDVEDDEDEDPDVDDKEEVEDPDIEDNENTDDPNVDDKEDEDDPDIEDNENPDIDDNDEENLPDNKDDNEEEGDDDINNNEDGNDDNEDNDENYGEGEGEDNNDNNDPTPEQPQGAYLMINKLSQLSAGEYYIGGYQGEALHLATTGITGGHCNTTQYTFTDTGDLTPASETEAVIVTLEKAAKNGYYIRFKEGYLTASAAGPGKLTISDEKSEYWIFSTHTDGGFMLHQSGDIDVQLIISPKAKNGSLLRSIAGDEEGNAIILFRKNE